MSSILTLPTWRHDAVAMFDYSNYFPCFLSCEFVIVVSSRLQGVLAGILYCALKGKVNLGCQRVVTIFSGDVAQLVRATGLYSVLASD